MTPPQLLHVRELSDLTLDTPLQWLHDRELSGLTMLDMIAKMLLTFKLVDKIQFLRSD